MSLYAQWQADALALDQDVMLQIDPVPNGGRLQVGNVYRMTASYPDLGLPADVMWHSSRPDVLTVDEDGNCTALTNGFATVTVMDAAGKAARVELIVFVNDPTVRIAGDVNMDGEVNTADIVLIKRMIAGGWNVRILEENADVNADGLIDLRDVICICRFLAGGWGATLV